MLKGFVCSRRLFRRHARCIRTEVVGIPRSQLREDGVLFARGRFGGGRGCRLRCVTRRLQRVSGGATIVERLVQCLLKCLVGGGGFLGRHAGGVRAQCAAVVVTRCQGREQGIGIGFVGLLFRRNKITGFGGLIGLLKCVTDAAAFAKCRDKGVLERGSGIACAVAFKRTDGFFDSFAGCQCGDQCIPRC